jgi:hypothetical protein
VPVDGAAAAAGVPPKPNLNAISRCRRRAWASVRWGRWRRGCK